MRRDWLDSRRPLPHGRAAAALDHARGRGRADDDRRLRAERDRVDARVPHHVRPARPTCIGSRSTSNNPLNSGDGVRRRSSAPSSRAVFGPWRGTELYANAGMGFHSNDARGASITRGPGHRRARRPRHAARAGKGAEVGLRTVRVRGLQSTVSLWYLGPRLRAAVRRRRRHDRGRPAEPPRRRRVDQLRARCGRG